MKSPTSLKDFKKEKIIGQGSFGSVYLVRRLEDNKLYAMKTVILDKLEKKEQENSVNEVRILASINHPNVIGYKEAFWDDETNSLNIIMEYADDGDLQTKINFMRKSGGLFSEKIIWEYAIQMILGLKALHDKKIMHRDLKSANIFLFKEENLCKIGDMNVSKVMKEKMLLTQTGTPYYASPEVWKDEPYSYKSDLWSIGCVIYELCTLYPPFNGNNLDELFVNVCKGKPERINKIYSEDLWKMILMLLKVDVKKRCDCNKFLNSKLIQKKILSMKNCNLLNGLKNKLYIDPSLLGTIKFNNINEIKSQLPSMKNYSGCILKKKTIFINPKNKEYFSSSKNKSINSDLNKNIKNDKNIVNKFNIQKEKEKLKMKIAKHQMQLIKITNDLKNSNNKVRSYDNKKHNQLYKFDNILKQKPQIDDKSIHKKLSHNKTEIFKINKRFSNEKSNHKDKIKNKILSNNLSEQNIPKIISIKSNSKNFKIKPRLQNFQNLYTNIYYINHTLNTNSKKRRRTYLNKNTENNPIKFSPTSMITDDRKTNIIHNNFSIKKIYPTIIRKNNSYDAQSKITIINNKHLSPIEIRSSMKNDKSHYYKKLNPKKIMLNKNFRYLRTSNSSEINTNKNNTSSKKDYIINEISLLNNNNKKIVLNNKYHIFNLSSEKLLKVNNSNGNINTKKTKFKVLRQMNYSPSFINYCTNLKEREKEKEKYPNNKQCYKKFIKYIKKTNLGIDIKPVRDTRFTRLSKSGINDKNTMAILGSVDKLNNYSNSNYMSNIENLDEGVNLTYNKIEVNDNKNNSKKKNNIILVCNKKKNTNNKINNSKLLNYINGITRINNKENMRNNLSPKKEKSQIYNNYYSINTDESIKIPIKIINLYKK